MCLIEFCLELQKIVNKMAARQRRAESSEDGDQGDSVEIRYVTHSTLWSSDMPRVVLCSPLFVCAGHGLRPRDDQRYSSDRVTSLFFEAPMRQMLWSLAQQSACKRVGMAAPE